MNTDHDHALARALADIGLDVSHREAVELAQLETAAEFEVALVARGLAATRNQAHQILLSLKRRAAKVVT
jgi:hypothetical protein